MPYKQFVKTHSWSSAVVSLIFWAVVIVLIVSWFPMFFEEKEITPNNLRKSLGTPSKAPHKGSCTYYLKELKAKNSNSNLSEHSEDAKCIVESYELGYAIRIFKNNNQMLIPVKVEDIQLAEIKKGYERISPFPPSLMWLLLKLGVDISIARYFRARLREYYVEEMTLNLRTKNLYIKMISSGYNFESQVKFFKRKLGTELLKVST